MTFKCELEEAVAGRTDFFASSTWIAHARTAILSTYCQRAFAMSEIAHDF
jgi:hypothetical protein